MLWFLALPALLLVVAGGNSSFRGEVSLPSSGEEMVTSPFELKQGWFGAPRIGLSVRQPINTSSVVNIALLNAENQVVLSFYKDTWRETGTWSEGGETGRWDEQDTDLTTEFRPGQTGQFRLRLSVEDFIRSGSPAPFQTTTPTSDLPVLVEIYTNTLNAGLLVGTCVVLLLGSGLLVWYDNAPKRVVRLSTRNETSLNVVETFPDHAILKVWVAVQYEEPDGPAPSHSGFHNLFCCPASLSISDAWGRPLLARCESLYLNEHQTGEDEHDYRAKYVLYFRLKSAQRLRLRIDVPEHLDRRLVELERLQLTVKELTTRPGKTILEDLA